MDLITAKTAEEVVKAYTNAGVNPKRIANLTAKFASIPDKFQVAGLTFLNLKIGEKELPAVPHFATKAGETIPIGQLFANYCDADAKATKIAKKDSAFEGKFLVVNNHKVNEFAKNKSEAEFVAFCMGKKFEALEAKDYPQYSGFVDGEITFHKTAVEAEQAIAPKSYRAVKVL